MADLKYYDGTEWVTLNGSSVALSTVGVDMTDCDLTPEGANGSFTADGTEVDGTQKYKLDLNLPRGTVVTESANEPAGKKCVGDLWIDTSTPPEISFTSEELLIEDGKRTLVPFPETVPRLGGAKDGIYVINGSYYSEDGVNWNPCTSEGNSVVWSLASCIIKGVTNGVPMYMDSTLNNWSATLRDWTQAFDGSYMPAQHTTQGFFWKGKFQIVGRSQGLLSGSPYQYIFNTTTKKMEGGFQSDEFNKVPDEYHIQNCDVMQFGDSKPDGTQVLCLARSSDSTEGIPFSGNWLPVMLVDNGGNGLDSFEPIPALSSVSDPFTSVKYSEVGDYWVAITKNKSFRSLKGDPAGEWRVSNLPISRRWSTCEFNGQLWIAFSTEPGDSNYIFSPDGMEWFRGTSVGPCWALNNDPASYDAARAEFYNLGTNGVSLFGFSTSDDPPFEYYKQELI